MRAETRLSWEWAAGHLAVAAVVVLVTATVSALGDTIGRMMGAALVHESIVMRPLVAVGRQRAADVSTPARVDATILAPCGEGDLDARACWHSAAGDRIYSIALCTLDSDASNART
jgi:hypothetical protein